MQPLQKGQNPRDVFPRHRERGKRKHAFTYDDYASLFGMSVVSVRRAVSRGSFDPRSLVSVVAFWFSRVHGRVPECLRAELDGVRLFQDEGALVYLVRDGRFVRVGVSTDPWSDLIALQRGNPRTLSMLACAPGGEAAAGAVRERLCEWQLRSGWYNVPDEELAAVCAELRAKVQ